MGAERCADADNRGKRDVVRGHQLGDEGGGRDAGARRPAQRDMRAPNACPYSRPNACAITCTFSGADCSADNVADTRANATADTGAADAADATTDAGAHAPFKSRGVSGAARHCARGNAAQAW